MLAKDGGLWGTHLELPSDLHTAERLAQGAGWQFHFRRVRGFQVIFAHCRAFSTGCWTAASFAKGEGLPSDLHTAERLAQCAGRHFHLQRVRGFQVICTLPSV